MSSRPGQRDFLRTATMTAAAVLAARAGWTGVPDGSKEHKPLKIEKPSSKKQKS